MKRLFIPIIAAFCMLGITACGSSDNSSSKNTETSAQTVSSQQETQTQQTEQSAQVTESGKPDEEKAVTEQTENQPENPDTTESSGKDTIVVYFSATGTTKGVAERIASVTNADIFELIPAEPYSDADLDWNDKNSRTTIEMNDSKARPAIANDTVDLDSYTTVYIGYPIWWGQEPRILDTFAEAYDLSGITVVPFCTSGSSGIGTSVRQLSELAGGADWTEGRRFETNASEEDINNWAAEMLAAAIG